MELTLRRDGITVKMLRERVEESTPQIVRRLHRLHNPGHNRDHLKELLEASGARYVSPTR